jgi:hypothetical protein
MLIRTIEDLQIKLLWKYGMITNLKDGQRRMF